MQNYHELSTEISSETRDYMHAFALLKEGMVAIDWYQQRLKVTIDKHLKKILQHNLNEEMEYVYKALDWLRNNLDNWDEKMRQYIFTERDIVKIEDD